MSAEELTPRPGLGRAALVVLAAGDGRRVGHDTNKVLLPLSGRRVFTYSIRWGTALAEINKVVLVIRERDRETIQATLARELHGVDVELVVGGENRHESEWNALQALEASVASRCIEVVVIHDAARPLAGARLFRDVLVAARRYGGALPGCHQTALVGLESGRPEGRNVTVQTPQAFRAEQLLDAYRRAAIEGFVGTDTASCIERYTDISVRWVPGDPANIKITFPEDLFLAERLLAKAKWDLSSDSTREAHR